MLCAIIAGINKDVDRRGNVTGCQFRPERSGKAGMSVIHALIDAIN